MSDNTGQLIPPSQAYSESAAGFRIPEITLGSLLVGYGLGFYPLLTQLETQSYGRLGAVLLSIQYASISITFIFLTVTFYAKYRTEILTMPHHAPNRPGMDLILAVSGLLAFGFSMATPWLFPILLGSDLLLTAGRQNKEYDGLASLFYDVLCKSNPHGAAYNRFRYTLKRHLRNHAFSELSGWGPTGRWFWFGSVAIVAVGVVVRLILIPLSPNWLFHQSLIALEGAAVMIAITIRCFGVLRRRATFILRQAALVLSHMDEQFYCLKTKLINLCPDRVMS